ncbi:hypothetical protein E0J16_24030 [Rhizobium pisi]|nr:hypothetical protein E0J16_24030 [Rhizobium pisi]
MRRQQKEKPLRGLSLQSAWSVRRGLSPIKKAERNCWKRPVRRIAAAIQLAACCNKPSNALVKNRPLLSLCTLATDTIW